MKVSSSVDRFIFGSLCLSSIVHLFFEEEKNVPKKTWHQMTKTVFSIILWNINNKLTKIYSIRKNVLLEQKHTDIFYGIWKREKKNRILFIISGV